MSVIQVLIIDDSAVVRQTLTAMINRQADMRVLDTAVDPVIALGKLTHIRPDVIILDLEMPRMDGLTFLQKLMESTPRPVIVFSSLTKPGSVKVLEALRLGALDVLGKPAGPYSVGEMGQQLVEKIRAVAAVPVRPRPPVPVASVARASVAGHLLPRKFTASPSVAGNSPLSQPWMGWIVLIGASTGGTEAIREIMAGLPEDFPPTLIVQHIPPVFSKAFAERLNSLSPMRVREAVDGDVLEPGLALVAPGNFHMLLDRQGPRLAVRIDHGPPVWHQRPAVDVLFKSADSIAARTIGVILTGMGRDGAEGLLRLRQHGARTLGQTEDSCVVYGMPKAAYEMGACEKMVPLHRVAETLRHLVATAVGEIPNFSARNA